VATINGTAGNDTLSGTSANDTINGLGGNDTILAGGNTGADFIDGGAGSDSIEFRERATSGITVDFDTGDFIAGDIAGGGTGTIRFVNIERVVAGNFDDLLNGNAANQTLAGQAGADTLSGGGGVDTLWGGSGADTFVFRDTGTANADRVNDWTSGSDKLLLDASAMSALGADGSFAAGDARFWSSASGTAHDADDRILFNTSTGQIFYDADGNGAGAAQLVATLQTGATLVATDIAVDDGSTINGTPGDDSLAGGADDDTINGLAGNDTLDGRGGEDLLRGGDGHDYLIDEDAAMDTLDGGLGNDTYELFDHGEGSHSMLVDAGGVDRVISHGNITLADGIENLTMRGGFQGVFGAGNALDNLIFIETVALITQSVDGAGGDDLVFGSGWRDVFGFAEAADYGNDTIDGGEDMDEMTFAWGASSGIVADMQTGTLSGGGIGGSGTVSFSRIEIITGTTFDDHLTGHDGRLVHDGDGNGQFLTGAVLSGEGGDDTIIGGAFHDHLSGGTGNDRISGGRGNDSIDLGHGGGSDVVVFDVAPMEANADGVTNFVSGQDTIQLDNQVFVNLGPAGRFSAGDERFFAGAGATSGQDASDRVIFNTTTGQIWYDADGSGAGEARLIGGFGGSSIAATDIEVIGDDGGWNTVVGTEGDDSITGTDGNDSIDGRGGNDTIDGLGGPDVILGGDGNDTLDGGFGGDGDDTVDGGAGDDFILGSGLLIGGDGNDSIGGAFGFPTGSGVLRGGAGNDSVEGVGELYGEEGNDLLWAYHEAAVLMEGGSGDDEIWNFDLDDTVDGGAGSDTALAVDQRPMVIDLAAGTATDHTGAVTATLANVENIVRLQQHVFGGDDHSYLFDDYFIGNDADNFFDPNGGNDTLNGGGGNDTLQARSGSWGLDVLTFDAAPGAANADVVLGFFSGGTKLQLDIAAHAALGTLGNFSSGDVRFAVNATGNAQDASDRVIYSTSTGELWYDADGSGAGARQLIATLQGAPSVAATDIAVINSATGPVGTAGDDWMAGADGYVDDAFSGGAGNDRFDGREGRDTVDGGAGNDTLDGGDGEDIVLGGDGNDYLRKAGELHDMYMSGGSNDSFDTLNGGLGDDTYELHFLAGDPDLPQGVDFHVVLQDSGGTDTVISNGSWTLEAGFENLTMRTDGETFYFGAHGVGNAQNNVIVSEGGGAILDGAAGDDTLIGAAAADDLTGGAGADTFYFLHRPSTASSDQIPDFASGLDRIRLDAGASAMHELGASGSFTANDARFHAGTAAHDADDRVIWDGASLWFDADGTGAAAMQRIATLQPGATLLATDISVVNGSGSSMTGTSGNDSLVGTTGNDTIHGLSGDDTLDGLAGNDSLAGGAGSDNLIGGDGNDTLAGWDVGDTVDGNEMEADTLSGGLGDDQFYVDNAGDALSDSGGLDTVHVRDMDWTLGAGFENLIIDNARAEHGFTGIGNELDNFMAATWAGSRLEGLGGNDTLIGGSDGGNSRAHVLGGEGNDSIRGTSDSDDTLDGGAGNDTISAVGDDILIFSVAPGAANADVIQDFAGDILLLDRTVHANAGPSGRFAAGDARFWSSATGAAHDADDRVIYNTANGQLWYDADGSGAGAAQLIATMAGAPALVATDIEIIDGSGPGQLINGTAGNDTLVGTVGNDTINGLGGNDTFVAGSRGGDDTIDGGSGTDSIEFRERATTSVTVNFGSGFTQHGLDTISFTGIERVVAGNFNDFLDGGAGSQNLAGQGGNDWLWGAGGADTLWGGAGADTFAFREMGTANADRVSDWTSGSDKVALDDSAFTAIGALGNFAAGDGRFWAAAGATGGHDANDRVIYNTSTGSLYYDADGSGAGAAQLIATFQGNPAVAATDIIAF
jgi:Ca2+-binding RTX toxin-like protein